MQLLGRARHRPKSRISPIAPTHGSSSSQSETTAMLAPSPSTAETLRGNNATRRLEPEDIKLLMKQGEQFAADRAAVRDLDAARRAVLIPTRACRRARSPSAFVDRRSCLSIDS
jgi:hypothetical protein